MANKVYDIIVDTELVIAGGDFFVDESTAQHQTELIVNNKGDFKQSPLVCVSANDYLDDDNVDGFLQEISEQFAKDGMNVVSVEMGSNGKVKTNANY
jgi:hypothetical protein